MKKMLITILVALLLSSSSCLTVDVDKKVYEELGPKPYDIVALKEVPLLEGSVGGNFLGWSGAISGGTGLMFAIKADNGSIHIIQVPLAKVRLVYTDNKAQLTDFGFTSSILPYLSPRYIREHTTAELIASHGIDVTIIIPKDSSGDFLRLYPVMDEQ